MKITYNKNLFFISEETAVKEFIRENLWRLEKENHDSVVSEFRGILSTMVGTEVCTVNIVKPGTAEVSKWQYHNDQYYVYLSDWLVYFWNPATGKDAYALIGCYLTDCTDYAGPARDNRAFVQIFDCTSSGCI